MGDEFDETITFGLTGDFVADDFDGDDFAGVGEAVCEIVFVYPVL